MSYLGSWKVDDLLIVPSITHRFDTGALTDADSVPSYRVYEDQTSTAILTGSMAKLDDTNTTGFYSVQLTLSAANGFEKGKCYTVYVTAIVNSVTGGMFHTFQIEAEVDSNRTNWALIDNPTTTVALTGTTIATSQVVASVTALTTTNISDAVWDKATSGHTTSGTFGEQAKTDIDAILAFGAPPSAATIAGAVWNEDATSHQTQGTFGQAIGDPVADTNTIYKAVVTDATGATVGVDVVAIQADTDNIQTRLPTSLVSGRMDSSVGAMAADVITAAATATDFATEINTGMATSAAVAALPTAATIADAVWDEVLSGHLTATTTGAALNAAGSAGDPWGTALPGAYGAGTAGKIIGDNVNATISSRATQTSVDDLPTNAELATALGTSDDAVLAQVALIKAQTDSLTFTVAGSVDANIHQVNDITVTGSGTVGDTWGPA